MKNLKRDGIYRRLLSMTMTPMMPDQLAQYGEVRAKEQLFDAVLTLWRQRKAEGVSIDELAGRIGRSPRWVIRALSGPREWTLRTFGQLVEAMQGEISVTVVSDKTILAQVLSDSLYNKTRLLSSISRMTEMDEFQKLFELGDITVRYILREMWLCEIRTFWFPLLRRITGIDPVPVEERGNVEAMRSRWVAWGKEQAITENR